MYVFLSDCMKNYIYSDASKKYYRHLYYRMKEYRIISPKKSVSANWHRLEEHNVLHRKDKLPALCVFFNFGKDVGLLLAFRACLGPNICPVYQPLDQHGTRSPFDDCEASVECSRFP